jgi:predicted acyltransferase
MVLVNNPGDWTHIYPPLAHAEWNGWTFTDLVFPFFLFAAGMAMPLSIDRRLRVDADGGRLVFGLMRRALVIFAIGLALNFIPDFNIATVRIPGVLQRIALCIVIAAPLAVYASTRAILVWIAILLATYSIPMLALGSLEPGRDFGASVDRLLLNGHLWAKSRTWDPEGLVSTLPAACSVLFGVIAGRFVLTAQSNLKTTALLLGAGVAALAIGLVLDALLMPINKNLWTPSYCIFMTGWSLAVFAAFHAAMDTAPSAKLRLNARRALLPFVIFGMNALFIFALSGFIGRLLVIAFGDWPTNVKMLLYTPLRTLPIAPEDASLLYAVLYLAAMFGVAWAMWRKNWFVKV